MVPCAQNPDRGEGCCLAWVLSAHWDIRLDCLPARNEIGFHDVHIVALVFGHGHRREARSWMRPHRHELEAAGL